MSFDEIVYHLSLLAEHQQLEYDEQTALYEAIALVARVREQLEAWTKYESER